MSEKKIEKNMILCCIIFAVYAVITLIGAANHEMWFDEAQAWTLARDNDIAGIFRQLGYEGHPPLWYLILYIPSHAGLPCTVMPYISWFITAIAGAIVMFKAPFHIAARSAVLFSGGFLFINSVMTRVYCLVNLIAVLIAILYPKRKEHPVLYGFLIALMANTHICMSGFIGIIGIFMLIDLFKDFKSKSVKQKAGEFIGLGIAGIGVLTMVIPLLHSLSLNSMTNRSTVGFRRVVSAFVESFLNVSGSIISYGDYSGTALGMALIVLSGFIAAVFVAMLIIMRHKTRPFLMLLFFWIFYTITSEVFWLTIPNRALVFMYMYFIIAWIAENEPENNASEIWTKLNLKSDTKAIKKLLDIAEKLDRNFGRSYIAAITVIAFMSMPAGAYYLFTDYAKDFCPSETAAEYIRNNFPEDSIFITDFENCPQIAAYLPEYKFYTLTFERYYTYASHEVYDDIVHDYEHIYNDLKGHENVYRLFTNTDIDYITQNKNVVYIIRDGMYYGVNSLYIEISEFDLEKEIASFI